MFKNLFKKKDTKSPEVPKMAPAPEKKSGGFFSKIRSKLGSGITSRIGKSAAQGEEILGVEITAHEIRLAQVTSNKANQWILEKFYIHKVSLPEDALVFENQDKLGSELQIALQKSKISTPNAALAIPVTSAIIRVVTSPLMNDGELIESMIRRVMEWESIGQISSFLNNAIIRLRCSFMKIMCI